MGEQQKKMEEVMNAAQELKLKQRHYDYDLVEKLLVVTRAMFAHYNALMKLRDQVKAIDVNKTEIPDFTQRNEGIWRKTWNFISFKKIRTKTTETDKEKAVKRIQKRCNKIQQL